MGGIKNAYKILARKPYGKRPHGIPSHGSEENITINLWETGWEGM
jgi:hypothetical protein